MRVGFHSTVLQGRRTGINNYAFELLAALSQCDPEVEFIGSDLFGSRRFSAQKSTIDFHTGLQGISNHVGDKIKRFEAVRAIKRRLTAASIALTYRISPVDLFHAFNYVAPGNVRAPILPVVYDLSFVRYPEMHPKERLRALASLPRVVDEAPFVHTISEFSKREIVEVLGCPGHKVHIAYPAAADCYRPLHTADMVLQLKRFDLTPFQFFLSVGTSEPRKNIRIIVTAFSRLSLEQRRKYPLVLVGAEGWGDVNFPPEADRMIREGSLRILGYVNQADLVGLYSGTRLMLFPSLYEGFGMPVVEAMGCGAAVAHSTGTSMDEITGTLAYRVPASDVLAWTNAMNESIEDERGLNETARLRRVQHARRFKWSDSAKTVLSLYREALRS